MNPTSNSLKKLACTLAACLLLIGCAPHRPAQSDAPSEKRFFSTCSPYAVAKNDGLQHFLCVDLNGHQWDVALRRR